MSNIFQWQLHGDGKTLAPGEVVEPDERLTWVRTAGIGAQHVIAMFGATFLVPILTGFDPSTTLFFTAMSTALFLLINRNVLPSYLGSSFGFIAPITAVSTANKGIAVASFGIMVTGILLALVGVLGGVTTLLYGMIGMIGIRIWVENKVNFDKPLNIMVAAITMIIAIGQFAFTVGGISFNGIAIGTIVILVAYHGLKAIGKATGTIAKDDPDIL